MLTVLKKYKAVGLAGAGTPISENHKAAEKVQCEILHRLLCYYRRSGRFALVLYKEEFVLADSTDAQVLP